MYYKVDWPNYLVRSPDPRAKKKRSGFGEVGSSPSFRAENFSLSSRSSSSSFLFAQPPKREGGGGEDKRGGGGGGGTCMDRVSQGDEGIKDHFFVAALPRHSYVRQALLEENALGIVLAPNL